MSGTNGSETGRPAAAGVTEGEQTLKVERLLDLDALRPSIESPDPYAVRFGGVSYPVRQIDQLTGREELDLAALDQAVIKATGGMAVRAALFDRAFHLVRILVPNMPERVRNDLTFAQASDIGGHAWVYASENAIKAAKANERPTSTDTGSTPAPEVKSNPVSVDSTASTQAA